jgi:hypothetical protein
MYEEQGRGSGLQSVERGWGKHMCPTVGWSNILQQASVACIQARLARQ